MDKEKKGPSDFKYDGILAYGVEIGRFVFENERKIVYAISDIPHIGPSDVFMTYQISKADYDRLLYWSEKNRIPNPAIPASETTPCRQRFLCGESAYCERYYFTLSDADESLVESY